MSADSGRWTHINPLMFVVGLLVERLRDKDAQAGAYTALQRTTQRPSSAAHFDLQFQALERVVMVRDSLLIASAVCSILVALLHVYVIAKGAPAYRFFGAGEQLAGLAERGSWLPALLTSGITLAFLAFAAYYLAAAGVLPKPPYLLIGLVGIAAVYTLRGAVVVPGWLWGMKMSAFDVMSSLISLAIGLLHGAAAWAWLGPMPTPLEWLK